MTRVKVIGPFPPPTHGFSLMTLRLVEFLEAQGVLVSRQNLSSNARHQALRHLMQIFHAVWASTMVLIGNPTPVALGCNGGLGLVYTALIAVCVRVRGLPITLHHHTYGYINTHSRLMSLICAVGGSNMIHVFLSPSMAHSFKQQYPTGQKSEVIRNAVFVPEGRSKTLTEGAPFKSGLISNLNREKGLYDFLDVARTMRNEGRKVEMHLAGPINDSEDLKQVQAAVAAGEVIWHGALYGKDKDAFFANLDLFLFPTRYRMEAQPTVIYEAFAAGVPVIAFDRGTISDQVRDCISVVPQNENFAHVAVQKIKEIMQMSLEGRQLLSDRAKKLYLEDAQSTRATLSRLFTTASTQNNEGHE